MPRLHVTDHATFPRPPREVEPAPPAARPPRRSDIAWLRLVGIAAVFVVHVSFVFEPWQPWHVQSPQRTPWAGWIILALAPWVMPLFMALAGESAWYALRHRGRATFVYERVVHILVPLLVGILVLVPPQVWAERRLSGAFDGSLLAFWPHFFEGIYPRGNFAWHHLWFLAYLFVFSVAALPIFHFLDRGRGRRAVAWLAERAERPLGAFLLIIPPLAVRLLLSETLDATAGVRADWHNRTLLPAAFIAGYVLAADGRFGRVVVERWRLALALAVASGAGVIAWAVHVGDPVAHLPPAWSTGSLLLWTGYALAGWCWVLALFGVVRAHAGPERSTLRRASEAVLPFYMIHQTVIVLVAAVVTRRAPTIPSQAIETVLLAGAISIGATMLVEWRK